jgi:hypothetical protein
MPVQTVISPFLTLSDDNKFEMKSQFRAFWAVAGPITVFVVLLWVLWIERTAIRKKVERFRAARE